MSTEAGPLAEDLRARMVERILAQECLTPPVEQALRQVERHRYVPAAPLAEAYQEKSVITHAFPDGTALSCASGPSIVAAMLDALQVRPGHRILEIGAGTGYNAALLATLAGRAGQVTTIDINQDVTAAARANLEATGFGHVTVLTGDGAAGAAGHGPYDRIIVTVGAWDIPRAWRDQLAPGGRLVLPLRWRGTTRAGAFDRHGDHWESDWVYLCGFVPMLGQDGEHSSAIDPGGLVTVHYDQDQPIDTSALRGALDRHKSVLWSGVTVGAQEPFDRIWLHLTATDNRTVRIAAAQEAVDAGLCTPAIATRSPALADGGSLAYFTTRRAEAPGRWDLGATGHGPAGRELAARIIGQITAWDVARTADPELLAYPAGAPITATLTSKTSIIAKRDIQLVVRYPAG
jgi:protein-L-isoaspartate(D-aspartate) O-methyltransferase